MDRETRVRRYIDLLLSAVDLRAGQKLAIRTEPVHWDVAIRIAEVAYDLGAEYVHVMASDPRLYKARIDRAPTKSLDYVPSFIPYEYKNFSDGSWCVLSLVGQENPDLHETLDADRNAVVSKAQAEALRPFREALQADRFAWAIGALPTERWAAKVLGLEPSADAEEQLWRIMEPILRLDAENPGEAWRAHAEMLKARAQALTERKIKYLRFRSGQTDLQVELLDRSIWVGGGATKPDGRGFLPNVPTEEVFTTPRKSGTHGRAHVSRPVQVLGRLVEGAWFEFESGRVVDFGADRGKETLAKYFEIDDNARYLGEIALVDSTSPVFASNTVFFNILYDENAACHMALGSSYPTCITGGVDLSADEYEQLDANKAALHTDFMIGTSDLAVEAETFAGETFDVMRDGTFAG